MSDNTKVFVAGHNGMVGSAIIRALHKSSNIEVVTRSRTELNLLNQESVRKFFQQENIDQVYLAAAKVGGIWANSTYPAEFIYENLMIESNIIHQAYLAGISKLLFLGSSCIYPKHAQQPIKEESLLSGSLEPTNEPYAIAKIAGIKLCESYVRQYGVDYRSMMPTNLYGPNDNFHPENSHVMPALMRRFHEAKESGLSEVVVWGSGKPMREFLHVDDLASAALFLMNLEKEAYSELVDSTCAHLNVGTGRDLTIKELAETISAVVGYTGDIRFDDSKPDGTPRKLLDVSKLNQLGWSDSIELRMGLEQTYTWYLENISKLRS